VRIDLPADGLVVLVGVAGSGKSTLAARLFRPGAILSSDDFRELVSGNPADQTATDDAFALLHAALGMRLARGLLSVVDATNVQRWARAELLDVARRHARRAAAIVLDLPLALCLERNAGRAAGHVPAAAIRRQHRALRGSLAGIETEGFSAVHRLTEAATVDRVQVALA